MAARAQQAMPPVNDTEATCPECRINQVETPFDYCSMCEMLTLYYRENLATPEQLHDRALFHDAYQKWRDALTWREIEALRDSYWTTRKRQQAKVARQLH